MQNTPNFNFTIAEGTDTVNLLTQCYPNFTNLDSILQAIKETGVATATATKTGTNFAVVRTDTDCNFFRFVATANYVAGDTFTVDGVPVTATSAAGTALASGAFVINQSVLCVLNSAVLTVFAGGATGNIDASDVDYDNTLSGLSATDVQAAIDEVLSDIPANAAALSYVNSGSGLAATNVQDAIDELSSAGISDDYKSTEEAIGTWIDGSTLYRKSYHATGSFASDIVLDAGFSSYKMIAAYGSGKYNVGGNDYIDPLPYDVYTGSARIYAFPSIDSTGLSLKISSNRTWTEYWLTVEYIK